jgi:hypothetical protein
VAENREEMFSAVYDLMLGLGEDAVLLNDPTTPFRLKQAAVKGALGHVCAFLRRFGDIEEAGLNRPLETLLIALLDLERGTQPELLKPRRAGHAPSRSPGKQALVFHAAFALDQLMDLGLSQEEGAQAVARQIKLAGISLTGRKPVTANRVVDWRDLPVRARCLDLWSRSGASFWRGRDPMRPCGLLRGPTGLCSRASGGYWIAWPQT